MSKESALRIAIVTHNVVKGDGQGRANFEIARYAHRQGAKVTLFADRVDPALEEEGIRWVRIQPKIRGNWLMHNLESLMLANKTIRSVRSEYDVIHAYGGTITEPHHINTSQYVHSAWLQSPMHPSRTQKNFYGFYQRTYSTVNARIERTAYQRAQWVVPASRTVYRELHQMVGVPESRMSVILNGADPAEFHPGREDRITLGLPEGVPLALFAGDIRFNRKNLDSVLKALVDVPNLHLAIVGTKAESPFPAMAEQLGVAARAHFLDFRKDIAALMRACDFFVFPSRYEACALVLVEALASGLPIITGVTTGGSEVVTPESGILLDDVEDVPALARAMQRLASDPELRQQMAARAAADSAKYTWDVIAGQYYALYQKLAGGR